MSKVAGILMGFVLCLGGCSYYSFTGATIPSHLNTVAIPLVEDNSVSTLTTLDAQLTGLLVDRFVGQTRLSLQPNEDQADALLRVTISRYVNQPTAVTSNEQASRNRVTITVSALYQDQVEDKELVQSTYSAFAEYDPFSAVSGLSGEDAAATAALEQIADDIFTAATSNW